VFRPDSNCCNLDSMKHTLLKSVCHRPLGDDVRLWSCGRLVVSMPSQFATKPPTRDRFAAQQFFPGSGAADSKRSESRGGWTSAIKSRL